MGRKHKPLNINDKFTKLTIIKELPKDKSRNFMWLCLCECGKETKARSTELIFGHKKSCGCLKTQIMKQNQFRSLGIGKSSFNSLFYRYKKEAKQRNIEWSLTEEQFRQITSQNCFYCGLEPLQKVKIREITGHYIYNGIDRQDNSIGYILNNCVTCCKWCNRSKYKNSINELLNYITRIYSYQKLKGNI